MWLFDKLREQFKTEEDQARFNQEEKNWDNLEVVRDLIQKHPGGAILKAYLAELISEAIFAALKTKDVAYLHKLESLIEFANKLKTDLEQDAIKQWAESYMSED